MKKQVKTGSRGGGGGVRASGRRGRGRGRGRGRKLSDTGGGKGQRILSWGVVGRGEELSQNGVDVEEDESCVVVDGVNEAGESADYGGGG